MTGPRTAARDKAGVAPGRGVPGNRELDLAVEPGVRAAALQAAQDAAGNGQAEHSTDKCSTDDQCPDLGQNRYGNAQGETDAPTEKHRGPHLVGGETAHHHRLVVQPYRQEAQRAVIKNVCHGQFLSKNAGGFGDQENADPEDADTDGRGGAEVSPFFLAFVDLVVDTEGVPCHAQKHDTQDDQTEQHEAVEGIVLHGLRHVRAFAAARGLSLR